MRKYLVLAALAAGLFAVPAWTQTAPFLTGTGWNAIPNTNLQISAGVNTSPAKCPPNNFNGSGYNFSDACWNVYTNWSGGALDDQNERMLITGGGHGGYSGNELYTLRYGKATPDYVRLTNPTTPVDNASSFGYLPSTATCGQLATSPTCFPPSVHTYGGLMVDPVRKILLQAGGSVAQSGNGVKDMWWLDLTSCNNPVSGATQIDPCTYTRQDGCGNGSFSATCSDPNWPSAGFDQMYFAYDRVTMTSYFLSPNGCTLRRYDASQPINARFSVLDNGNCSLSGNIQIEADPIHRQLMIAGDGTRNGGTTGAKVFSYSLDGPYTLTDRTAEVGSACANALSASGSPGLDFDERTQQFVGIPAGLGNTVWVVTAPASGSWSCTSETYAGGPPAPNAQEQGVWGRFRYSPREDAHILCGDPFQNCFYLRRGAVPTSAYSDWLARSTAGGVLRAAGFDQASDFVDVSNQGGYASGVYPPDAGGNFPQRDTTNFVSGGSSLKFVISPGSVHPVGTNPSGYYGLAFGPDANVIGVGAGGDVYLQFHLYLEPNMVNYFWPNVGGQGWKVFILYGPIPGPSCTGLQFVHENTNQHNFLSGYTSCGSPALVTNGGVTPYDFEQGDYTCTYPGASTDPPCFIYPTATWFTVYWHVHVNSITSSNASANFEAFANHGPNTPMKKWIALNNFVFDAGNLATDKLMRVILQDYFSSASGTNTTSPASFMSFDEAIISRQPIATPIDAPSGGSPAASLSPASSDFSVQVLSTSSNTQTVTLTNTGTSPLTITGINFVGTNAVDFLQSNTCPGSLSASSSCNITVTFIPSAFGYRTANLSVSDNASGSPHIVQLTGFGANPSALGVGRWLGRKW